jgi:hypothetical protein
LLNGSGSSSGLPYSLLYYARRFSGVDGEVSGIAIDLKSEPDKYEAREPTEML